MGMKWLPWDELPEKMRTEPVRAYYDRLAARRGQRAFKRAFDVAASMMLLTLLAPVWVVIAVMIRCDSKGSVMFRQARVTQYGRVFRIYKFRTMVDHAESLGAQVTTKGDARITRVGRLLRKTRLDELPQLINVLLGDMSFVGTRPEVEKYVEHYSGAMWATLLMPAGITSEASLRYKDEAELLSCAADADAVYVEQILPEKMRYNLDALQNFSLGGDCRTMLRTVGVLFAR
jgi:lipopolysaccharide/colanic/teichoic acid biosynthesis glycosyltransferase